MPNTVFLALGLLLALTSGCASNPTASAPDARHPGAAPHTAPPRLPPSPSADFTQRLDIKLTIQFDWWKLLQSPQLNTLIEQVFAANPTTDAAQATLLKMQQSDIVRSGYFHSFLGVNDSANGPGAFTYTPQPSRSADDKFIGHAYYNLPIHQLAVAYLPEMLRADTAAPPRIAGELRHLQLAATYRTLAGNLIACATQEASLRAQMAAARKIIAIDQRLSALARKRLNAGLATEVSAQQTAAEHSARALLMLKEQFEQTRGLLRLLLGIAMNGDIPENFDLAAFPLSAELPPELPATLVEQRPDVRAAQLDMQPTNTSHQSATKAAIKNVADTLRAIHNNDITLKAGEVAVQNKLAALETMRKRYTAKEVNYQEVLVAERNAQFALLRLAQARAQYQGSVTALYHAVGGAWWNDALALEIEMELRRR